MKVLAELSARTVSSLTETATVKHVMSVAKPALDRECAANAQMDSTF